MANIPLSRRSLLASSLGLAAVGASVRFFSDDEVDGTPVFAASEDGNIYHFNPHGELRWETNVGHGNAQAIDQNGNVLVGGLTPAVSYIDGGTGDILWQHSPTANYRGLSVDSSNNFYVGGWADNTIYKFRESADGSPETVWEFEFDDTGILASQPWQTEYLAFGTRNDYLYLVEEDQNEHPQQKWRHAMGAESRVRECLWTQDGDLYAINNSGVIQLLTNITETEPTVVWETSVEGGAYGGSVTPDGGVVVASSRQIYKLSSDGALDWEFEHPNHEQIESHMDYLFHQVAVPNDAGDTVYAGSYDNIVWKIDLSDGSPQLDWQSEIPEGNIPEINVVNQHYGV